jgi:hypothetical protein
MQAAAAHIVNPGSLIVNDTNVDLDTMHQSQDIDAISTTSTTSTSGFDVHSPVSESAVRVATSTSTSDSNYSQFNMPDNLSEMSTTSTKYTSTAIKKPAALGALGAMRAPAVRATPRIVSLPLGADRGTLLGLLKANKSPSSSEGVNRVVSMPAGIPLLRQRIRTRTFTEGSSFATEEEDSVVIMCNSSTEVTNEKFLRSGLWISWMFDACTNQTTPDIEPAAPRPIPALHGPSSLPYARCPS